MTSLQPLEENICVAPFNPLFWSCVWLLASRPRAGEVDVRIFLCAGALALALSGCAAIGPRAVVSPQGATSSANTGTIKIFSDRYGISQAKPFDPEEAAKMVAVGTELEYQLCADFFRTAGQGQQWLLFGKDFLTLAGTITTGVLGVVSAASGVPNATAIAWAGLSAASGVALLSTVQRSFLFSEDNVQAVQDLTLKAVSVARAQALSPERMASYTFASGVSALVDVQSQCEVQNILVLVRQSIGAANPVPDIGAGVNTTEIVKARIGGYLFSGTPISDQQLQALYWLFAYFPAPTEEQIKTKIYPPLSVLNVAPVDADGKLNSGFTFRPQVTAALATLPPAVVAQIRANIKELDVVGLGAGPSRFGQLSSTGGTNFGRIGVTIR